MTDLSSLVARVRELDALDCFVRPGPDARYVAHRLRCDGMGHYSETGKCVKCGEIVADPYTAERAQQAEARAEAEEDAERERVAELLAITPQLASECERLAERMDEAKRLLCEVTNDMADFEAIRAFLKGGAK